MVDWPQSRGFYALPILALVALGLLLTRRRKGQAGSAPKRGLHARPRRGRAKKGNHLP